MQDPEILIMKMLVGNETDMFSAIECKYVIEYIRETYVKNNNKAHEPQLREGSG